jgi:23S rRNA pseudouridine1911/1915/1917 synthase
VRKTIDSATVLLEALAALVPGTSRTTLRQMLANDRVRVNGELAREAKRLLEAGDVVEIASKTTPSLLPPELNILFEDEDVIVVTKAEGLLTVASKGERERTAQAYLNDYLAAKGIRERIHVVHRLDRDTSGVLVFAKSFEIREKLKDLFAAHDIERIYIAIVEGEMEKQQGTFQSYLAEDEFTYQVKSVKSETKGKLATTHYRVIRNGPPFSMVEVTLETGRKNQIRVHFSEAGHPVVGDERYGATANPLRRLGLHAKLLGFVHPRTGKKLVFTAPLPEAFKKIKN